MDDLEQKIADIKEIIAALNFCSNNNKKCKKCKKKDDCLKFIRSSIALCLQFKLNEIENLGENEPNCGIYV